MIELTPLLFLSSFFAGVLMFLAPCTLPLVPAYLAILSGQTESEALKLRNRRKIVLNASFFSLGFSLVFILLGVLAGIISTFLAPAMIIMQKVSGALLIIFAIVLALGAKTHLFTNAVGFPLPRAIVPGTKRSSLLLGALFSVGWTPCVGPVLGAIFLLAGTTGTVFSGTLLLTVFSLGLAGSFILAAYFLSLVKEHVNQLLWLSRWSQILAVTFLLLFGILLLLGEPGIILNYGTQLFNWLGLDWLYRFY